MYFVRMFALSGLQNETMALDPESVPPDIGHSQIGHIMSRIC